MPRTFKVYVVMKYGESLPRKVCRNELDARWFVETENDKTILQGLAPFTYYPFNLE